MQASTQNEQTGVLAIRLLNFMAFADTGWIDLKPITLLFGRNSSGKSAIIRALRLLKQSLQADTKTGPLVFQSRAGLDQGAFENTVHLMNKDEKRYIVFSFRCSLAGKQSEYEVEWFKEKINTLRKKQNIELVPYDLTGDWPIWLDVHIGVADVGTGSGAKREEKIVPALLRIESPWSIAEEQRYPTTVFAIEKLEEEKANELGFGWHFWSDIIRREKDPWPDLRLQQDKSGFWPLLEPLNTESDYKKVTTILKSIGEEVENFLKKIVYLGPLRPEPQRIYALTHLEAEEWRQRGLGGLVDFLAGKRAGQSTTINKWVSTICFGELKEPPQHAESLIEPKLDVPKQLEVLAPIEIQENQIQEKENIDKKSLTVNLADLGSGVAQVLPVVMLSLIADKDDLVMIEQPELHLHPSGQAELGDLFIEKVYEKLTTSNPEPQITGVRFLLETHSEHLLLRLQKRIAQTRRDKKLNAPCATSKGYILSDEHVQIIFIHRETTSSKMFNIEIDELGRVHMPPPKFRRFFSDDFTEASETQSAILDIQNAFEKSSR
jgi:predicted ATPase